jgi:hypothetical protein
MKLRPISILPALRRADPLPEQGNASGLEEERATQGPAGQPGPELAEQGPQGRRVEVRMEGKALSLLEAYEPFE